MADYTTISAKQLLQTLENQGLLATGNIEKLENFIVTREQQKEMPLYLRVLAGVGAFFSSIFLLGFLGISRVIDFNSVNALISWGVAFIGIALFIQRMTERNDTFGYSFVIQLSFCAMAVGKGLVVGASAIFYHDSWGVSLAMLLVTVATYHLYPLSLDRFMSVLLTLVFLMGNVLWDSDMANYREVVINLLFILQVVIFTLLMINGRVRRDYIPLSYAFAFSLSIIVISLVSQISLLYHRPLLHLGVINFTLALFLIILIAWVAGGIHKLQTEPLAIASIGAIILSFISASGLLLAIGFLILGYAKHERLLIIMGSLLLPVFLFFYYYHLGLTLAYKSGILIMSGLVLLVGYFYLKYRGLNQ